MSYYQWNNVKIIHMKQNIDVSSLELTDQLNISHLDTSKMLIAFFKVCTF